MGKRETLFKGKSEISGDFIVEEIEGPNGKLFRRLIFMNNQGVVQSEALVRKGITCFFIHKFSFNLKKCQYVIIFS